MKTLVIYGSSRRDGNSESLTQKVVEGLEVTELYLQDKHFSPIIDKRHTPEGFNIIQDDYEEIIQFLLTHDIFIFATPIYWYGMSGIMKDFFDRWSQYLRDKRFDFKANMKGKQAFVIVTGGDKPNIKGLPLIEQFHYIFQFMNMEFVDYIIGEGNSPGEVLQDQTALTKAERLHNQIKEMLQQ